MKETAEKKGALERLADIDNRIIFAVAFIVFIIPQLRAIGLPMGIHPWTQKQYDLIESLPQGSIVAWDLDVIPGGFSDVQPGSTAVMKHMFRKNFKIVFFAVEYPEGTSFFEVYMNLVKPPPTAKYGEDYVFLGFIPGRETASAELAKNMHVGKVDFYGTPLEKLPLMQKVKSVKDINLLYSEGFTPPVMYSVRQWATPYGIPLAITGFSVNLPEFLPFYNAGLIDTMLDGAKGGAQYERLIGEVGLGAKSMDAQSMIHIFTLGLLISGNVLFWLNRIRKPARR